MNPHFFTAPFYFAFIWFRVQGSRFKVQGSRFKVQGSRFKVQGSRFRVQGSGVRWRLRRLFLLGRCPEVAFKSPVTSRSYDTREGIISHAWCQILRLSLHLFWLGLFTHRAFSSAQDDDTRGRMVSQAGGFAAFFRRWYSRIVAFPSRAMLLS